jgi:hypothetical protein
LDAWQTTFPERCIPANDKNPDTLKFLSFFLKKSTVTHPISCRCWSGSGAGTLRRGQVTGPRVASVRSDRKNGRQKKEALQKPPATRMQRASSG